MRAQNYVGQSFINNQGLVMKIIECQKTTSTRVRFENGYETVAQLSNIKRGRVANPYHPTVYGVGYHGEGTYLAKVNGEMTPCYRAWQGMLTRCYKSNDKEKFISWKDCSVCEEWHNFQNFARWWHDNYYEVGDETMHLDKDWLTKGNKVYSPDTCVIVPQTINSLLISRKRGRGNCVIGVSKSGKRFCVQMTTYSKHRSLGMFETELEAFNTYKRHKEQYIKEVAECYKPHIPTRLYEAMLRYEVEITD